ncbi:MAG: right-handed parallel beta-helix repeat-containing protein, partial [Bacteroidota bacterium]
RTKFASWRQLRLYQTSSYGKVDIRGTKNQPIKISSSDRYGRGLHLLGSPQSTNLMHVHFRDLNTFHDKSRFYNGAVSVYDRTLFMAHCRFENSQAEDALNIVRSAVDLSGLIFTNCRGDGLDADFSTGQINSSYFSDIGGDGLDFSGSHFELSDLKFHNIVDKGISAGEGTILNGRQIEGSSLTIGIAAKDNAQVEIHQLSLDNCNYGLAVFRKKAIYPPAQLSVDQFAIKNSNQIPWVVEQDHTLTVNGNDMEHTHPPDSLRLIFYPPE